MLGRIHAIAITTFKEALRQKVFYILIFFSLVMILFSLFLGELTLGANLKMVKDMGLASIKYLGVLITVFVGAGVIFKEIERRTIFTILTKPVSRAEFIFGKYIGLLFTLGAEILFMTLIFFSMMSLYREPIDWHILKAILLIFVELSVITAATLMFSSYSSLFMSTFFSLSFVFIGHATHDFAQILKPHVYQWLEASASGFTEIMGALALGLLDGIAMFSLDHFSISTRIVHGVPTSWAWVAHAVFYGLCFNGVLLMLAMYLFKRKEFQ